MRWNLSQQLDAGVLHSDVWIKALRNGARDQGGALLLEQLNHPLLLRHERVDLCCLPVEKKRNSALLLNRRQRGAEVFDKRFRHPLLSACPIHLSLTETSKCIA